MYTRINKRVFFILPTFATGIDEFGYVFFEFAWFNIAIGIGKVE